MRSPPRNPTSASGIRRLAAITLFILSIAATAAETPDNRLTAFGCDIYRLHASRTPASNNLAFSPANFARLLSLLADASAGTTKTELNAALHRADALEPSDSPIDPFAGIESSPDLTFAQATGLWPAKNFAIIDATASQLALKHKAQLAATDFSKTKEAAKAINQWANEQTNGAIPQLLPPDTLKKDTRMVAASSLHFKAKWAHQFDAKKSEDANFTLSDGKTKKARLMHLTLQAPYVLWPDGTQALQLDFAGGPLSILILLPPSAKHALAGLEARLTPEFLHALHTRMKPQRVNVTVPKFSIKATIPAMPILQSLGAGSVFANADFSPLSSEPDLTVGTIVHEATFTCDESGAEAAAASAAALVPKSVNAGSPPEFKANRPFVFAIIHRENLSPMLMGRLASPESPAKPAVPASAKRSK